jgi:hypothetical protein
LIPSQVRPQISETIRKMTSGDGRKRRPTG